MVLAMRAIAPALSSTRAALDFIMQSIEKAGFKPGTEHWRLLPCATEYFKGGKYELAGEGYLSLTPSGECRLSQGALRGLLILPSKMAVRG